MPVSSSWFCLVPGSPSVERVLPAPGRVTILARARSEHAACPGCGTVSRRAHSHRVRVLRDLPWQGRPVSLRLRSRRFRCNHPDCSRRIFTEHLGDVAGLHARRTDRMSTLHRCIGLAVSGEAGPRLAEWLGNHEEVCGARDGAGAGAVCWTGAPPREAAQSCRLA